MKYDRLKQLRIEHGYTQQKVADKLNVQREVYRRYENGIRALTVPVLIQLADLYETSTDYIVNRTSFR